MTSPIHTTTDKRIIHAIKNRNRYFWIAAILLGLSVLRAGSCNSNNERYQMYINSKK